MLTHLSLRLDGVKLPLRLLADGPAAPQLPAHQCVAECHGHHRHQIRQAQEYKIIPFNIRKTVKIGNKMAWTTTISNKS